MTARVYIVFYSMFGHDDRGSAQARTRVRRRISYTRALDIFGRPPARYYTTGISFLPPPLGKFRCGRPLLLPMTEELNQSSSKARIHFYADSTWIPASAGLTKSTCAR